VIQNWFHDSGRTTTSGSEDQSGAPSVDAGRGEIVVPHPAIGSARRRSTTLLEEESALHRRILDHEEAALLEYLDRSGHIVYCVALALTEDRAAAEELTEGLFVDLWKRPDRFDPRDGPMVLQLLQRLPAPSLAGVPTAPPRP
jgi:hypothetical protein